MAKGRYDKYDFMAGGFRALLAADWPAADIDKIFGMGIDVNGNAVKGAGVSGLMGVVVITSGKPVDGTRGPARKAGDVIDIMTAGELVECTTDTGVALAIGTKWGIAPATGIVAANVGEFFGMSLENSLATGTRIVVRFNRGATAMI